MQKLFIFDYDNTIAKPKSKTLDSIRIIFSKLLVENKISILTGGRSIKSLRELLIYNSILDNSPLLRNLYLCPEYGNTIYSWDNDWYTVHASPDIDKNSFEKIEKLIKDIEWNKYTGKSHKEYRIYDKGSVVSVNCLGNDATEKEKNIWDKDRVKRKKIKEQLLRTIGDRYDIFTTGRNTVDIVPKGSNKADNILRLSKITFIPLDNVIYFGDEFTPDGNDYPILSINIKIHRVSSPSETESILKEYI